MNADFIVIVRRVVADRGAPDLNNLRIFNSLLADYALGRYRRERKALIAVLQKGRYNNIDDAIAAVKLLPIPDAEGIKNAVKKTGGGLQKGINAAGIVGAEVLKTGVAVAGTTIKTAGELVKSGYEAIGGAEGIQKGTEAAGKVATEILKVGVIVAVEAGKVIGNVVKDVAVEIQKSKKSSEERKLLNDPDDYIDYFILNDDDDD
jgi:hypothetical protein